MDVRFGGAGQVLKCWTTTFASLQVQQLSKYGGVDTTQGGMQAFDTQHLLYSTISTSHRVSRRLTICMPLHLPLCAARSARWWPVSTKQSRAIQITPRGSKASKAYNKCCQACCGLADSTTASTNVQHGSMRRQISSRHCESITDTAFHIMSSNHQHPACFALKRRRSTQNKASALPPTSRSCTHILRATQDHTPSLGESDTLAHCSHKDSYCSLHK